MRKQISTFLLFWSAVAGLASRTLNAGDAGGIDVLRDAQRANQSRYAQGEMRVTYREGQTGSLNVHSYTKCHLIWSGERAWTELESWPVSSRDEVPSTISYDVGQWLVDGAKTFQYAPEGRRAFITANVSSQPPVKAWLTPESCWYGRWGNEGVSWLQMLDPRLITKVDNTKIAYTTAELADGRIEVVREDGQLGTRLVMVFDMAKDGNLEQHEFSFPSAHYKTKGTCTWARSPKGDWYLARREEDCDFEGPQGVDHTYKSLEVTEFDYGRPIDPKRFTIESLKLPDGATIRDEVRGRTLRIGDRDIDGVLKTLGALSDLLKSRGFASEKRK
jgi:hypothetical protein